MLVVFSASTSGAAKHAEDSGSSDPRHLRVVVSQGSAGGPRIWQVYSLGSRGATLQSKHVLGEHDKQLPTRAGFWLLPQFSGFRVMQFYDWSGRKGRSLKLGSPLLAGFVSGDGGHLVALRLTSTSFRQPPSVDPIDVYSLSTGKKVTTYRNCSYVFWSGAGKKLYLRISSDTNTKRASAASLWRAAEAPTFLPRHLRREELPFVAAAEHAFKAWVGEDEPSWPAMLRWSHLRPHPSEPLVASIGLTERPRFKAMEVPGSGGLDHAYQVNDPKLALTFATPRGARRIKTPRYAYILGWLADGSALMVRGEDRLYGVRPNGRLVPIDVKGLRAGSIMWAG